MDQHEKPAKEASSPKRRMVWIVLIIVVLLAVVGTLVYIIIDQNNKGYDKYVFDTAAMEGRIKMMTEAEIQEELNRVVEEGMFNISIASAIVFESPTSEGQARIENIAANRYHMQVEIL